MRKHFLVKPKLQLLHLALTMGAVASAIVIGYFFVISILSSSAIAQLLPEPEWVILRSNLRWGFVLVFVILLLAVAIEHIIFFHSIIGPLFSLENALKRMEKGEFQDPIRVRDSDQLKELITSFENLRKKVQPLLEKKEP